MMSERDNATIVMRSRRFGVYIKYYAVDVV